MSKLGDDLIKKIIDDNYNFSIKMIRINSMIAEQLHIVKIEELKRQEKYYKQQSEFFQRISDATLAELERTNGDKKTNLIDADELKKEISGLREVPHNRWDDYCEGRDDGLCLALDAIDDMVGKGGKG
jgi:thioesterase domain-containing protein